MVRLGEVGLQAHRPREVRNGLLLLAPPAKAEAEVEVHLRRGRPQPDRLRQVVDGGPDLPLREESKSQVVVRVGELGLQPDGLRVVKDGLVRPALEGHRDAQAEFRVGIVGIDVERVIEVLDRFVDPSLSEQLPAEVVVGEPVAARDPHRMGEQLLRVLPVRDLAPACEAERGHDHECARAQSGSAHLQAAGEIVQAPDYGHEQPDERKVGKAIRHRLLPRLHDPDDGKERRHEPEPADPQVGAPPSGGER